MNSSSTLVEQIPTLNTTIFPSEILLMAVSLFLVTFTIGILPTKLQATPKVMNLISIFGAGLLVGAALIIIVPEGMSVLYQAMMMTTTTNTDPRGDAALKGEKSERRELINRYVGASLIFGFTVMLLID
jgi:zinc transporter 9